MLRSVLLGCVVEDTVDTGLDTVDITEPNTSWIEEDCSTELYGPICDFTLMNQYGENVTLSDIAANGAILLDFSAMWCGPCNSAGATSQALQDKYEPYGFTYVTVLIEDSYSNEPDLEDLEEWATDYGVTAPVLAGSRDLLQSSDGPYYLDAWPMFYYIDSSGIIQYYHAGYNEELVDNNVSVLLGL